MENRLINYQQEQLSKRINSLVNRKDDNKSLNESIISFKIMKGKYLIKINNLNKINHLAKFKTLNKWQENYSPSNIKLMDYHISLNDNIGHICFFVLPKDEEYIETKEGRHIDLEIDDIIDFIKNNYFQDAKEFIVLIDNNEYFIFNDFWFYISEDEKVEIIKEFICYCINETNQLPELI